MPGTRVFRLSAITIVIIPSFLVDLLNHIKTSRIIMLVIQEQLEQRRCHSSALFSYPVQKKRNYNSLHYGKGCIKGNVALQNMNITAKAFTVSINSCHCLILHHLFILCFLNRLNATPTLQSTVTWQEHVRISSELVYTNFFFFSGSQPLAQSTDVRLPLR